MRSASAQECSILPRVKQYIANAWIKGCEVFDLDGDSDADFKVEIICKEGYEFSYKKDKETFILNDGNIEDLKYRMKCYRKLII
jgi:hypothetical protein